MQPVDEITPTTSNRITWVPGRTEIEGMIVIDAERRSIGTDLEQSIKTETAEIGMH